MDKREQRKKLSFTNTQSIFDVLFWTTLAIILGLVASFIFLPLLGVNPFYAVSVMFSETFSSTFNMGNILIKTAPLILTGLAFAFTYKANLYNIGAQGQFYAGCICASTVSLSLGGKMPGFIVILFSLIAAVLGGAIIGLIIGFLKAKFNANEFLISMMSTYVIQYVMQLLLRTLLQESKHEYLKTDYLDKSTWLPKILPGTSVSLGIVFSVLTAIISWYILYRTSMGYRIRVTGLNQDAARMSGIAPRRQYMIAFAISGAMAGLAGLVEVNGMQHMLLTGFDTQIGSYGIGIAILANANPLAVIPAALLFGFLQVGGTALGHASDAPASVIDLLQGFVMLFVLMSFFFRRKIELDRLKKKKVQEGGEVA